MKLTRVLCAIALALFSCLSVISHTSALSANTVSPWSTSSNSLPSAPFLLTSVAYNDYFYVLGGDNDASTPQSSVYFANLSGAEYPSVANQQTTVLVNSSTTVNVLSGVSGNPDSATLHIISGPSHGVAVDPPGTITYTPNSGYSGTDSLVYQVYSLDDESLCSQATLTFDISAAAPDTGYGVPSNNIVPKMILISSLTSLGVGLLFYQKYRSSN